jgi:pilus assembly protein Flp/PilA
MKTWLNQAAAFVHDEEGASAVEYGLLIAGIAAVVMVAVYAIGTQLNTTFTNVKNQLAS